MDRFPQELATAIVGVFPRGNPSTNSWQQARGRSLEISAAEARNSDNPAMSAMFAVMKAFDGVEGSLRRVSSALGQARDNRHQLQRDHDAEIERLTAEMAQLTRHRDQATQRTVVFEGDVRVLREQVGRLTTANRNTERMLTHVLHQRNEAWYAENVLRARQFELEQQLADAEEYNDNLHEEVHRLNNQLNPYVPPGAVEMDLDEDEDPEEPEAPAEEPNDAADGDNANVSDLDSDHDE
jgi:chromosome segregation ATPase